MKRLIVLLIAIIALIAGVGRTKVAVISDCIPVSAEITEKQVSHVETPVEAALSPVLPFEDNVAIDAAICETEQETADFSPLTEPATEAETEPGDGGDRVTVETDIEKTDDPVVTEPKEMPESFSKPEPAVVPDVAPNPVIIQDKPTVEISPVDEPDAEHHGSNAPVFVDPCLGGPNPFDDDTPTEVDDHNSDEFVGDGDRSGEGIHF